MRDLHDSSQLCLRLARCLILCVMFNVRCVQYCPCILAGAAFTTAQGNLDAEVLRLPRESIAELQAKTWAVVTEQQLENFYKNATLGMGVCVRLQMTSGVCQTLSQWCMKPPL